MHNIIEQNAFFFNRAEAEKGVPAEVQGADWYDDLNCGRDRGLQSGDVKNADRKYFGDERGVFCTKEALEFQFY